eukprot:189634-Chlamydomonas_euryale.AAC.2
MSQWWGGTFPGAGGLGIRREGELFWAEAGGSRVKPGFTEPPGPRPAAPLARATAGIPRAGWGRRPRERGKWLREQNPARGGRRGHRGWREKQEGCRRQGVVGKAGGMEDTGKLIGPFDRPQTRCPPAFAAHLAEQPDAELDCHLDGERRVCHQPLPHALVAPEQPQEKVRLQRQVAL